MWRVQVTGDRASGDRAPGIERRVIELVEITPHGGLDRLDQPVDRLARP